MSVSTQPLDNVNYQDITEDSSTPVADSWTLYRAGSGTWYAAGIVADHLQLYAITPSPQWRLSCDVALAPYRLRESTDPAVQSALKAVDAFGAAVGSSAMRPPMPSSATRTFLKAIG